MQRFFRPRKSQHLASCARFVDFHKSSLLTANQIGALASSWNRILSLNLRITKEFSTKTLDGSSGSQTQLPKSADSIYLGMKCVSSTVRGMRTEIPARAGGESSAGRDNLRLPDITSSNWHPSNANTNRTVAGHQNNERSSTLNLLKSSTRQRGPASLSRRPPPAVSVLEVQDDDSDDDDPEPDPQPSQVAEAAFTRCIGGPVNREIGFLHLSALSAWRVGVKCAVITDICLNVSTLYFWLHAASICGRRLEKAYEVFDK